MGDVSQLAAMEPGTYGRDDLDAAWQAAQDEYAPQWSPALTAGMTARIAVVAPLALRPQWSPALTAGMTTHLSEDRDDALQAAMEPGTYGRDDAGDFAATSDETAKPQWSPALTAGMTWWAKASVWRKDMPQWSPALTAGMTTPGTGHDVCHHAAAMEPGTYGRDDLTLVSTPLQKSRSPQWSPALTAGMT